MRFAHPSSSVKSAAAVRFIELRWVL